MKNSESLLLKTLVNASMMFVLAVLALAQEPPPIRSLPLPDARVSDSYDAEGNLWIRWSADHRLGYVQGWLEGSYWGHFNACVEAQIAAPTVGGLQDKCMSSTPAARVKSEEYTAEVTEFYSRFPQDRALPMRRLLGKLLERGMTVDGVHNWLDGLIESVHRSDAK
jgi:hypothetical protein